MDSYKKSVKRVVHSYLAAQKAIFLICDEAYAGLAYETQEILGQGKNERRITASENALGEAFKDCLKRGFETLVFLHPRAYSKLKPCKWLDFKEGEPKVRDLNSPSYAGILPLESRNPLPPGQRIVLYGKAVVGAR